ncbi:MULTISPECIES: hypothetical protein [Oceanibaculum]|uniref:Uncharacterized protein n=1 Tax=Oceanibaculum indicum TaxID=526216 RepID=A0A420WAZ3_9PROT|nr:MULTISPECIES: hypothetical protein [Oceanibaculum]MCH2395353.1 hypothetical protein [Oceanibaculum sp.]RKQ68145.1 hypothetical protein BCL74_3464 [Oceanibaculum indicum]
MLLDMTVSMPMTLPRSDMLLEVLVGLAVLLQQCRNQKPEISALVSDIEKSIEQLRTTGA